MNMAQPPLSPDSSDEPRPGVHGNGDAPRQATSARAEDSPSWPPGSELLEFAFSAMESGGPTVWMELGDAAQNKVVLVNRATPTSLHALSEAAGNLVLVTVPATGGDAAEWVHRLQDGFESAPAPPGTPVKSILLTLHGAQILWRPNRLLVLAPPERLPAVCRAIVAASFYEAELRCLEQTIDAGWEHVQADSPLAFEFDNRAIPRRSELSQRFQAVLALRTRFARLAPHVLVPHVHPPTLASQIGERFRERTRMAERLELVDGKLDTQERIYELCSHRASEFMVARTGHNLEWVIIILLLTQTMILLIDFLSSLSG